MKYLYIIGNGFDIFSGLRTRYVDFKYWLELKYPFIYENLCEAYGIEGEWWHDFEQQLGQLDVKRFVSIYDPCKKATESIYEQVRRRKEFEKKNNLPPSFYFDSPCARRLAGLLDVLQYCFEKWIDGIVWSIMDPKYTHIESDNSYFINFNYTDTLRMLYDIPDERVLHIHGRATKHEHLIFGHNRHLHANIMEGQDAEKVCEELNKYHKNPFEYIFKYNDLPLILKDVERVYVYGLSFSPVDMDYMNWIVSNTPQSSLWEISWYTEEDKKRICDFILRHSSLLDRYELVQLKPIEKSVNNKMNTNTEECRKIWKEAIHLCELEPNEEEATSFVRRYYNKSSFFFFSSMDDRTLLLTFVGLVVYEKKFHLQYGSTSPAIFCYRALLNKANLKEMDKKFIFDIGDWAADYSENGYVPMGNYRGYGPRKYYKFLEEYQTRVSEEKAAAQKRKEKRLAEGREKALSTKRKHQERKDIIRQLREKTVDESLRIIEQSEKPVFYYIDLIEEWFKNNSLSKGQKDKILSLFPSKSTRHNNRLRKFLVSLS